MRSTKMKFALSLAIVLVLSSAALPGMALADNWPAWRGPSGQGFCEEKGIPLTWSDKENVKWKIDLEHQGNSTPVIWGDRIFLTQANTDGQQRSLLCLNRADGKQVWRQDVEYAEKE